MIKAAMRFLAIGLFFGSMIYIGIADIFNWIPQPVTAPQLALLTSCVMLTILSKRK